MFLCLSYLYFHFLFNKSARNIFLISEYYLSDPHLSKPIIVFCLLQVELRLLGPYPKTAAGNEYLISIVDPISKWICVQPVCASRCSQGVASFVIKSFCQFGFAECLAVGFATEYLQAVQTQFKEELADLTNFAMTLGNKLSKKFDKLHIHALNSKEDCAWVTKLLEKFIGENSGEWDRRLQRFLFNFHTTIGNDSLSPYFKMFGRQPNYFDGEEKENTFKIGSPVCYGRRRLQNSILQVSIYFVII